MNMDIIPSGTSKPERSSGLMLGTGGELSCLVELLPVRIRSIPKTLITLFSFSKVHIILNAEAN